MFIKLTSLAAATLLHFAAPSMPNPVLRPDISTRNQMRIERKSKQRR